MPFRVNSVSFSDLLRPGGICAGLRSLMITPRSLELSGIVKPFRSQYRLMRGVGQSVTDWIEMHAALLKWLV